MDLTIIYYDGNRNRVIKTSKYQSMLTAQDAIEKDVDNSITGIIKGFHAVHVLNDYGSLVLGK